MHTKEDKSCEEIMKEIYKKKLESWNIQTNPKYDSNDINLLNYPTKITDGTLFYILYFILS